MIPLLIAGALGYLLGSIPTAYLLVRWKSNLDIRKQGSGNVGTLNSYEVTNSKLVGIGVLLIDLLKGIATVVLVGEIVDHGFPFVATGGVGAVLGHNFPVWLGFKGGRGLATAAGVMLMLGWFFLPVWIAAWFVGYKISKDVNVGNGVATLAMLAIALLAPADILTKWIFSGASADDFRVFAAIIALLILVRLVQPIREFVASR